MAIAYLLEQGAKISKTGQRLIVEKDDQKIADLPLIKLTSIFIFGNIQVSTQALGTILESGVDLAFFSLYGQLRGILTSVKSKNIILRLNHYQQAIQPDCALQIAKVIVGAKLANQISILQNHLKNYTDAEISQQIVLIRDYVRQIEPKTRASSLLGVEGSASVRYYWALRRMFRGDLKFNGRNRRPPQDEVNALLSFGYILLGNEYTMLLNGYGLDPYLGFLHGVQYGRPSLALDLLEPFRPVIDRFVLSAVNLKEFQKADFEYRDGGVYLRREKLKAFFQIWENFLNKPDSKGYTVRDYLRQQAESLINWLNDKAPFKAFLMR